MAFQALWCSLWMGTGPRQVPPGWAAWEGDGEAVWSQLRVSSIWTTSPMSVSCSAPCGLGHQCLCHSPLFTVVFPPPTLSVTPSGSGP